MPESRIITIAIREDGAVLAKMYGNVVFSEANLNLHTKPWQLDDLIERVRQEIGELYSEMHGKVA